MSPRDSCSGNSWSFGLHVQVRGQLFVSAWYVGRCWLFMLGFASRSILSQSLEHARSANGSRVIQAFVNLGGLSSARGNGRMKKGTEWLSECLIFNETLKRNLNSEKRLKTLHLTDEIGEPSSVKFWYDSLQRHLAKILTPLAFMSSTAAAKLGSRPENGGLLSPLTPSCCPFAEVSMRVYRRRQ